MFIDIGYNQLKKYNQNAYGDYIFSKRYPDTGRLIAVLSDGLGSGVKANILSCMTSTMLLKFIEAESDIKKACEIIMNSLPICKVRKISYSTFSAIDCTDDGTVKIVEEGNPEFVWIRDNQVIEPECEIITSKTFVNRHMHIYKLKLQKNDRLIFCSDGVTQAGLGSEKLKLGLRREGLIEFVTQILKEKPNLSSHELSTLIVNFSQKTEPDKKARDDISAMCIYFREPRESLVFTGPPYHANKDKIYSKLFINFNGKKAICGGTTANLISRELNIPIKSEMTLNYGKLPAISHMKGVDLVTEGILTLTKVSEYLESEKDLHKDDAAAKLVRFFQDSDYIKFMVGAKLNQAHYDPTLPVEIEIRKNIIKKISKLLEEKYIKKVDVQYI